MSITQEVTRMENLARLRGKSASDICVALEISRPTWQRWKNGLSEPSISKWRQLEAYANGAGEEAA